MERHSYCFLDNQYAELSELDEYPFKLNNYYGKRNSHNAR